MCISISASGIPVQCSAAYPRLWHAKHSASLMLLECMCFVLDPLLSVVWTRSVSTQWKISLKERKQAQQLHCRVQSCCVLQQVKRGLEGAKWFEGSELVCKMVPFAPQHWVTENCRSKKLPKVGMSKVFSFLMFLMTNTPNCFLHSCFSVPPG